MGFGVSSFKFRDSVLDFRVQGFRVSGLVSRDVGFEFRGLVLDRLEFQVPGLGPQFRVQGFRVSGLAFRDLGCPNPESLGFGFRGLRLDNPPHRQQR